MSYTAAVDHLYARGLELAPDSSAPAGTRRKFDLEHMRILARALGNPQDRFPSVLIAGTNGKGSTAATLASILTAAGYRTALYTSPHLSRVNERIQIDGHPISDDDFARLYFQVDTTAERLVASGDLPHPPSFFETLTALAFLYFAGSHETEIRDQGPGTSDQSRNQEPETSETQLPAGNGSVILSAARSAESKDLRFPTPITASFQPEQSEVEESPHSAPREAPVDIAILEVGLGGRLDATNIVSPLLSILTDISLDHQEYLGHTISEITREKAGILRPRGTLITLPQHPKANQTIGEVAAALDLHAISAAQYIPTADKLLHPSRHPERMGLGSEERDRRPEHPQPRGENTTRPSDPLQREEESLYSDAQVSHPSQSEGREESSSHPSMRNASSGARSASPKGTASAVPQLAPFRKEASVPEVPLPRNRYTVTLGNQPLHVDSPLFGQHQQRNLALALAAAEELRNPIGYNNGISSNRNSYKITNAQIEAGIRDTRWPGRLELVPLPGSAPILLDVAHNPAGAWTLRAALAQLPEDLPRTLLFSCLRDKDLREMSQILLPLFDSSSPDRPGDHILFAPINSPRAVPLELLAAAARDLEVPAETTSTLIEALARARTLTPPNGLIVATGSVYLIGELRALLPSS